MMTHPFLYTRAKARGKTIFKKEEYQKMLDLEVSEILVRMQHKDPLYREMIESYSVYFSSEELIDYITRHAPPKEVGEFYQMLKFVNKTRAVEDLFKALWYRFVSNDIRIFFIGLIEKMDFEEISLWMHGLKPLTLDKLRHYYDKGLPYIMLKKAGLPKKTIDIIIDAFKKEEIGRISFALYAHYMSLITSYDYNIARILSNMELKSLIIKSKLLGLDKKDIDKLIKEFNGSLLSDFYIKPSSLEGAGCCLLHTEARDFISSYTFKVNNIEASLAYLLIKEIQASNLRLISKYKALGLSKDEVMQRLTFVR